jgi:F-type H+-transporting ATPase subunit b
MLIDWFTVGAQAINFLILVWLLKHFLYKPILDAIDAREKRIATELADADAKKTGAQKERDEFQHKNEEFDRQRAALLGKAVAEAKVEHQRLLDETRKAADALTVQQQEARRSDAHNLNQAISRRTRQEVFAIARKALADLATTSLEERLGEVFTRRLREMDGGAKETLGSALRTSSDPAVVRSAFDLPAGQRAAIQNALNETFSAEIRVRFETAPDLVSGIELTANGQKVGWSIADYLASLEKGVGELLKEQDKPEPKPDAKPEPKSEAEAVTEPKSAAKMEPKPVLTPEPKPQAKAEPEPEKKSEVKPAPKPEVKAAPEPETKSEATPEPESVPKSKTKVEAEPEAKAESEPEARVATPETGTGSAPEKPEPVLAVK